MLTLRHTNPALLDGDYVALNQDDAHVMSYLRRYQDEAVLVVLNMSAEPQKVSFDLASQGFSLLASQDPAYYDVQHERRGAIWQAYRWRRFPSISGR